MFSTLQEVTSAAPHDSPAVDDGRAQHGESEAVAQEKEGKRGEREHPSGNHGGQGRALSATEKNARLLGWITLPVVTSPLVQRAPPGSVGTSRVQKGGGDASSSSPSSVGKEARAERLAAAGRGGCNKGNKPPPPRRGRDDGACADRRVDAYEYIARDGGGRGSGSPAEVAADGRDDDAHGTHTRGVLGQGGRGDRPVVAITSGSGIEGVRASEGLLGRVWFHVPSATLVKELPVDWVAFARVSGGILADVSLFCFRRFPEYIEGF